MVYRPYSLEIIRDGNVMDTKDIFLLPQVDLWRMNEMVEGEKKQIEVSALTDTTE